MYATEAVGFRNVLRNVVVQKFPEVILLQILL